MTLTRTFAGSSSRSRASVVICEFLVRKSNRIGILTLCEEKQALTVER